MLIRNEQPADIAAIRALHDLAFGGDSEGRIVDALRTVNKLAVSLVAEQNGQVVGHAAFKSSTSSNRREHDRPHVARSRADE